MCVCVCFFFVMAHCIALMLLVCVGSTAGCGAPGSERAHPAGAGRLSRPPGVYTRAAEILRRPDALQRAGLDRWVFRVALGLMSPGSWVGEQHPWLCVSVLQEAVSTGDPELVQLVLQYRDFKRATERLAGIPELLSKLRQVERLLVGHSHNTCVWESTTPQNFVKGL